MTECQLCGPPCTRPDPGDPTGSDRVAWAMFCFQVTLYVVLGALIFRAAR